MNATVIDTLRLADRLREAGFESSHAEGMARALGDELADRVVTKSDLDEAVRPIYEQLHAMDAKFEARMDAFDAKFDGLEPRFDAIDAKFEAVDAKFVAMEARFDAVDTKFDAVDGKFDAVDRKFDAVDGKFDAVDRKLDGLEAQIDSLHREFSGKFNILVGVMALGFTLLFALGGYNAVAPRLAVAQEAPASQQASELPAMIPSQPVAVGETGPLHPHQE